MDTDVSVRGGLAGNDILFFLALLASALAFGAALAHALELPNKIGLSRDDYFIVQKAYAGWDRLAYLLLVQLLSLVGLAVLSWHRPQVLWLVVVTLLCLFAAQAVFWIYTYPANVATQNWTTIPDNWQMLRRQWEYSHLAGALFQLVGLSALMIAALRR